MRRRSSFRPSTTPHTQEHGELVSLWIYRALVTLGAHRTLIEREQIAYDNLAIAIGLGHWLEIEEEEYDSRKALADLKALHRKAEESSSQFGPPADLAQNVANIGELLGLDHASRMILTFTMLLHVSNLLEEVMDQLGLLSSTRLYSILTILLDLPENEVKAALSRQGKLAQTGLVVVDHNSNMSMRGKLDILSPNLAGNMLNACDDPLQLLRETIIPCTAPTLELDDYTHIEKSLELLLPYLRQCIDGRHAGVNIFIHGDSGTGKSQLARVLAKVLTASLFEVSREDRDGDPITGERRLRALRAAQGIVKEKQALLLFDEVEDIFGDGMDFFGVKSTAQKHKGWMNQILEENPVPTLWLTNAAGHIDPAFMRRFDMVFELPIPPRRQREKIIQTIGNGILPEESIARIASIDNLSPAVFERASRVVSTIRDTLDEKAIPSAMEHLLNNTLKAQGRRPISKVDPNALPAWYDPGFINCEMDLGDLANGLENHKSGRLCLYGPPGTGKTAFGRWLADRLEIPLTVKRASDLISMWVGETEKNIAKAFSEAEQEGTLLLIDEIDSFLQDRRGAQNSWEVTAVNEMLTQMEGFPGLFIASTNLMDGLDQASLRRFDLKLHFRYLNAKQAWGMFCQQASSLGLEIAENKIKSLLSRLDILTPGDFAAVARQHRFRPLGSAEAMLKALEEECLVKPEGKTRRIGFV